MEILLVAVLLSIFAGLAMVNISALFDQNKTKAATAELRMFMEGLSFCVNDFGIYPKLNFLNQPLIGIVDPLSYDSELKRYTKVTADFHYIAADMFFFF